MSGPLPATVGNSGRLTFAEACRDAIALAHGRVGIWCYQAFHWLNAEYFDADLPVPLIQIAITPWSHCLGLTGSRGERPPVITLHPSLWTPRAEKAVWSIPIQYMGDHFALDVLLHELIHVSVDYRLRYVLRKTDKSSHDNPAWCAEVNRIAPLLGLTDVDARPTKVKREGKTTRRVCAGTIDMGVTARFPHAVRQQRGQMAYYLDRSPLPFEPHGQVDVPAPAERAP